MTLAHVYIMEDRGAFKVGHSKDPRGRRKQLGAHLTLVHTSEPMSNAGRVERLAHRLLALAGKRIAGELFSATLDEAKAAIERAERIAANLEPDVTKPLTVNRSRRLRKHNTRGFTLRVDDAFLLAVKELQRLSDGDIPTKSEIIRQAVMSQLEHKRAARR